MRWHTFLHPAVRDRHWDYDYPYGRLTELLTREGVPWISLLPPLRSHYDATGRPGCYDWDGHWDAEGHAVVADALAPFVAELARTGGSGTNGSRTRSTRE